MNSGVKLPGSLAGRTVDHIALAVTSLESGSAPLLLLGAETASQDELVPAQQVKLRLLRFGGTLLELLCSTSPDGPIARFIARRGSGLHHLALASADLERDMRELTGQGLQFLSAAPQDGRAGSRIAFIHPRSAGGVLIELVEHPDLPAG